MAVRKPAVAGYFYPSNPKELLAEIEEYMPPLSSKIQAYGAICPHAGYVYSGHVAGAVYAKITPKETFILLGPNHTGYGSEVSLMCEGQWEIPLGRLDIDKKLAKKIETALNATEDTTAHIYEHSLEVQLPFIYKLNPSAKIVPIALKMLSLKDCEIVATVIANAVKELGIVEKTIIIASTDMSHYLSDDLARKVDALAIERIKNFDPEGLYKTVLEYKISMCGFIPTTIMLYATKLIGAKEVQIIKYTTSAEVSRDYDKVVGYLGAVVI